MLVCATHQLYMQLCTLAYMSMHESCLLVCCPYFNKMKLWTSDPNLHLSLADTTFCLLSCLFVWKLKVPGRIKHFLQKACANSLPTKVNLMKRKILTDPIQLCGRFLENTKHAFWDCEAVRRVWCKEFRQVNQFEAAHGTLLDLVDRLMSKPRVIEMFVTTAWFTWTH